MPNVSVGFQKARDEPIGRAEGGLGGSEKQQVLSGGLPERDLLKAWQSGVSQTVRSALRVVHIQITTRFIAKYPVCPRGRGRRIPVS